VIYATQLFIIHPWYKT